MRRSCPLNETPAHDHKYDDGQLYQAHTFKYILPCVSRWPVRRCCAHPKQALSTVRQQGRRSFVNQMLAASANRWADTESKVPWNSSSDMHGAEGKQRRAFSCAYPSWKWNQGGRALQWRRALHLMAGVTLHVGVTLDGTCFLWGIHVQTKPTFICGIDGVGGGGGGHGLANRFIRPNCLLQGRKSSYQAKSQKEMQTDRRRFLLNIKAVTMDCQRLQSEKHSTSQDYPHRHFLVWISPLTFGHSYRDHCVNFLNDHYFHAKNTCYTCFITRSPLIICTKSSPILKSLWMYLSNKTSFVKIKWWNFVFGFCFGVVPVKELEKNNRAVSCTEVLDTHVSSRTNHKSWLDDQYSANHHQPRIYFSINRKRIISTLIFRYFTFQMFVCIFSQDQIQHQKFSQTCISYLFSKGLCAVYFFIGGLIWGKSGSQNRFSLTCSLHFAENCGMQVSPNPSTSLENTA